MSARCRWRLCTAAKLRSANAGLKLVSFGPDSLAHKRARQYLGKRDGLTGLWFAST